MQTFTFGNSLTVFQTSLTQLWSSLKWMIGFSWTFTIIGLLMLVFIVNLDFRAKQQQYLCALSLANTTVFIGCVFSWIMWSESKKVFQAERAKLGRFSACVSDANWRKIPQKMHTEMDLTSFHTTVIIWLAFTSIAFFIGSVISCTSMQDLER